MRRSTIVGIHATVPVTLVPPDPAFATGASRQNAAMDPTSFRDQNGRDPARTPAPHSEASTQLPPVHPKAASGSRETGDRILTIPGL
jgi:hypothetical protein